MDDLISRQAAIDAVAKWFYDVVCIKESDGIATIFKRLRELPSAQPHGKWILETYQIRCSNCNKLFSDYLFPAKYCPNCGARMDGGESE